MRALVVLVAPIVIAGGLASPALAQQASPSPVPSSPPREPAPEASPAPGPSPAGFPSSVSSGTRMSQSEFLQVYQAAWNRYSAAALDVSVIATTLKAKENDPKLVALLAQIRTLEGGKNENDPALKTAYESYHTEVVRLGIPALQDKKQAAERAEVELRDPTIKAGWDYVRAAIPYVERLDKYEDTRGPEQKKKLKSDTLQACVDILKNISALESLSQLTPPPFPTKGDEVDPRKIGLRITRLNEEEKLMTKLVKDYASELEEKLDERDRLMRWTDLDATMRERVDSMLKPMNARIDALRAAQEEALARSKSYAEESQRLREKKKQLEEAPQR